jgi:hypothetical protein
MSAINVPYDKLVAGNQYMYGNSTTGIKGPVIFKRFITEALYEFESDGYVFLSPIMPGRDSPFYILPIATSAAGRTRRRYRR